MKIAGKELGSGPNVEYVVIPRSDGDIPFTCSAVLDFEEFDKVCPAPEPPMVVRPGGLQTPDMEDADYTKAVQEHGKKRMSWMIVKSLSATEGLEWETVNMQNPDTWENYEKELQSAGFAFMEVIHIRNACLQVNMFDETKMIEARKRFLAGRQELEKA